MFINHITHKIIKHNSYIFMFYNEKLYSQTPVIGLH